MPAGRWIVGSCRTRRSWESERGGRASMRSVGRWGEGGGEMIVQRHEVLRTHFEWVEGEPVQIIEEGWQGRVEELDVRGREEGEQEAKDWVRQETRRSYDLGRGPLLRVGVVRIAEE